MLNVMSESPVADRRGGVASAFSSSSESSITLRFVMSKHTQRLSEAANAFFDAQNVVATSKHILAELEVK